MIKASIKKTFYCDKEKLWEIITDNTNYSWRSDLSEIVIVDKDHFIEYTKNNFPTYFTIIKKDKLKSYEFEIENANIKGRWIGLFKENIDGSIDVNFTEKIEVNSFMMKILAKPFLRRVQKRYIKDLEKALK